MHIVHFHHKFLGNLYLFFKKNLNDFSLINEIFFFFASYRGSIAIICVKNL